MDPALFLVGGWLFVIVFGYSARSVHKTTRHGDSLSTYTMLAAIGLVAVALASRAMIDMRPLVVIGLNMLFAVIAVCLIPAKRALTRRIDANNQ